MMSCGTPASWLSSVRCSTPPARAVSELGENFTSFAMIVSDCSDGGGGGGGGGGDVGVARTAVGSGGAPVALGATPVDSVADAAAGVADAATVPVAATDGVA